MKPLKVLKLAHFLARSALGRGEYFVGFYWFNARTWIVIPHSRPCGLSVRDGEVSSPSPITLLKILRGPTAIGSTGSRPFGYSFASVKFGKRLSWKSFGDYRRKRLIAIAILTNLVIFLTQKQFLASTIPWPSDQPSLNSSVLSNRINNSDNLDDSILLPETPSLADESDEDLAPPGFKKLIYLGVFLVMTTTVLVIGMLSKQIARALIGASLLTIVFFVLFFVII